MRATRTWPSSKTSCLGRLSTNLRSTTHTSRNSSPTLAFDCRAYISGCAFNYISLMRIRSRVITHDDFQNYLEGRYYISPSQLYSVVRLLPSKQGYDVPVSGDWLTIAVIAERGPMKYTQAPVGVTRDDKLLNEGEDQMDALPSLDGAAQSGPSARPPPFWKTPKEEAPKASGKKYVNLKLIDFGCRSHGGSADSGKAKIRGDAFLSLLLFESDTCDVVMKEGGKKEKVYRGGSRGAFERMSKLREGAVVAFLNPKILKPFQVRPALQHPASPKTHDSLIAVVQVNQLLRRESYGAPKRRDLGLL